MDLWISDKWMSSFRDGWRVLLSTAALPEKQFFIDFEHINSIGVIDPIDVIDPIGIIENITPTGNIGREYQTGERT